MFDLKCFEMPGLFFCVKNKIFMQHFETILSNGINICQVNMMFLRCLVLVRNDFEKIALQ